jgi:hypothetical protein
LFCAKQNIILKRKTPEGKFIRGFKKAGNGYLLRTQSSEKSPQCEKVAMPLQ